MPQSSMIANLCTVETDTVASFDFTGAEVDAALAAYPPHKVVLATVIVMVLTFSFFDTMGSFSRVVKKKGECGDGSSLSTFPARLRCWPPALTSTRQRRP